MQALCRRDAVARIRVWATLFPASPQKDRNALTRAMNLPHADRGACRSERRDRRGGPYPPKDLTAYQGTQCIENLWSDLGPRTPSSG